MTTVTVSLKQPNDLHLIVGDKTVTVSGWNSNRIFQLSDSEKVGLTDNVPEEHWKAWLAKFKNHPLHVNGLIFASSSESKVKAETKERKGVKSGLEALDKETLDKQGE